MKKFKFQRLTPAHVAHVAHVPENTGFESCAPLAHVCASDFKKEQQNATCAKVRNTCARVDAYSTNDMRNMRNVRKGAGANIRKIRFPMNGKDLAEFKSFAEAGVQFDFSAENPAIPTWAQPVPLRTSQLEPCYCCGCPSFWRKKDNQGGRWICTVCHPPILSKDEVEYLQ